MDKQKFKDKLDEIFSQKEDCEVTHCDADDFLVEVLESEGYDLSRFKSETKWYA